VLNGTTSVPGACPRDPKSAVLSCYSCSRRRDGQDRPAGGHAIHSAGRAAFFVRCGSSAQPHLSYGLPGRTNRAGPAHAAVSVSSRLIERTDFHRRKDPLDLKNVATGLGITWESEQAGKTVIRLTRDLQCPHAWPAASPRSTNAGGADLFRHSLSNTYTWGLIHGIVPGIGSKRIGPAASHRTH